MAPRLRVGIVGLGRRFARYLPALATPGSPLEVAAVCDATPGRAGRVARRLGCAAAVGPVDLLDRPEVDALLLFDAAWYRLWPLERAAAAGKPVFCDIPLHHDDAHADALWGRLADSPVPVLMAPAPELAPAFQGVRRLLDEALGAPRLARWDVAGPSRGGRVPSSAAVLRARPVLGLLRACAVLMGGEPAGVRATAPEGSGFASLVLDFAGGRAAQVTLATGPGVRRASRLEVAAERGGASAVLPRRLRWNEAGGEHAVRLPGAAGDLLGRFAAAVASGEPPRPGIADAYRALGWWRACLRSQAAGGRVGIEGAGRRGSPVEALGGDDPAAGAP